MKEVWKDVIGYEGIYQISNLGRVMRLASSIRVVDQKQNRVYVKPISKKIIKQNKDNNGYWLVNLSARPVRVHRILAMAFLPKRSGANVVNHIDGNKSNNSLINLEWCTPKENSRHAINTGLFKVSFPKHNTPVEMLDEDTNVLECFNSIKDACRRFGFGYRGSITEVCNGKRKHCFGYKWRYADEK